MLFILIQLIKNYIIIIINISKKEQSLEIFAVSYTAAHHTNLPNFSVKSKQTSKKFYSLSTPPLSPGNVLPTNSNCDSYSIILTIKDENTFILVLHNCRRNFSLCWKKEENKQTTFTFSINPRRTFSISPIFSLFLHSFAHCHEKMINK